MADHVASIANKYNISPRIFRALIGQESGGNQAAVSPAGAIGRTQLMPDTAAALGVNPHDPIGNLVGGAKYLRQQLDHFGGDYKKALAAYNAGPGAVEKYGGVPPYAETQNYVSSILSKAGQPSAAPASPTADSAKSRTVTTSKTTPGVDNSAARRGLILQFLQQRHNPQALVGLASGLQDAQDTPSKTTYSTKQVPGQQATAGALVSEANKINDAKVPYQWGGGHQAKAAANSPVTPLDCSGAVSRVLGINPRVSGQFQQWGKAGDGGSKGVTVYSNADHVFMKINGHFFGTSRSNPGGGAGWIPQGQISPDYLRGFTARHQ